LKASFSKWAFYALKTAMKKQGSLKCPDCGSSNTSVFKGYPTIHNGIRQLFLCKECNKCFSETRDTAMQNIKTPISKVAAALKIRSEGTTLRGTGRILGSNKRTIAQWEDRFADQKATLMLYAFCHEFVSLTFEGDELYTIVGKRTDPMEYKGWTAVVMDRASCFIVDQRCGKKMLPYSSLLWRPCVNMFVKLVIYLFCRTGKDATATRSLPYAQRHCKQENGAVQPRSFRKAFECVSKTRETRNINEVENAPNTKRLSGNILIRIKICQTLKFMQTILRDKTLRPEEKTALLEEERTHMPRQKKDYNEPWMFNN
jgi:transposase-like protein